MLLATGTVTNDNRMANVFYAYLIYRNLTIIPGILDIRDFVRYYGCRLVHVYRLISVLLGFNENLPVRGYSFP